MTNTNQIVDWNYYSKEGKIERLDKSQIIQAIGTEEYCEATKSKLEKEHIFYSYTVRSSKSDHESYILIQNWTGFYD